MAEKNKYSMNRNLLTHFDDAVGDSEAAFKDSEQLAELAGNECRYIEEAFIAEGGMKKIYSCIDTFTGRKIAKAVPGNNSDSENIDRFIKEAKVTASLQHPHIVPVYELAVDDLQPYFTMKLLGGHNLGQAMKNRTFDQNEALDTFLKVCDALAYAHSKGVLHLDIKPENIQLDEFGDVLVCDWGLAKGKDDKASEGSVTGTPGFMAPEQYEGKTEGASTDVYSLGALLYFLMTGSSPIEGSTADEIKQNALSGNVILPSDKGNIPKSLQAVIMKSLDRLPFNRYQSVSELTLEVRAYINGFATKAEDAGFLTILILLIKRYKTLSLTIAFFLVMISVLTSIFIVNLNREKNNALHAEQESMDIREETAPELINLARKEYKLKDYKKALEKANIALKLDPNNQAAAFFKARCLTGEHQFAEALKLMENLDPSEKADVFRNRIIKLKEVADKQPIIAYEGLPEMIKNLRFIKGAPGLRIHFLKTCTEKYTQEQRLDFARRYLQFLTVKDFNWQLTEEGGKYDLDISNNLGLYDITALNNLPIKKLNASGSPVNETIALKNAPLEELNLSGSNVFDISPIINCPLKILDISGTNVRHIHLLVNSSIETLTLSDKWYDHEVLLKFKNLKKLVVSPKFFNTKQIAQMREKFEVEVRE